MKHDWYSVTGIDTRTRHCLMNNNVADINDLATRTRQELMRWDNFGKASLTDVEALLLRNGLALAECPVSIPDAKQYDAGYARAAADILAWLKNEAAAAETSGGIGGHGTSMIINNIAGVIKRGEFRS